MVQLRKMGALVAVMLCMGLAYVPVRAAGPDDMIPMWTAQLQSPDKQTRLHAINGISLGLKSMTQYNQLVTPLARVLPVEPECVPQVLNSLVLLHSDAQMPPAVEPLIALLSHSKDTVRAMSAQALGTIGNHQAVVPLIQHLNDPSELALRCIVRSLGKLGDASAAEALNAMQYCQNIEVRKCVVVSLGQVGDRRAVPQLLVMMQAPNVDDMYHNYAIELLGKLGDVSAVQPLISRLRVVSGIEKSRVMIALGKLGDRRAIPVLIEVMKNATDIADRNVSCGALQTITGQTINPEADKWQEWWNTQAK